jgi:hypothetical protein
MKNNEHLGTAQQNHRINNININQTNNNLQTKHAKHNAHKITQQLTLLLTRNHTYSTRNTKYPPTHQPQSLPFTSISEHGNT